MKIAIGFKGERMAVLPQAFVDLMEDNPLTGDLYIKSLGYISNGMYHFRSSPGEAGEYLMIYCTGGRGTVQSGDSEFEIAANQYVVIDACTQYTIQSDSAYPWTIYWINFRGAKAKIYASAMGTPKVILPEVYSRIEERLELFESIISLMNGHVSIDKLNYANILFAHFMASYLYADLFREEQPKGTTQAQAMVSRVTHYMSENIEKTLTLQELADYTGYCRSYFYRNFIREIGCPPIDYFIKMKINKASIYLIKSSMSISQISAKLGFSCADYFSKTFKRVVGITPSEFRAENFRL